MRAALASTGLECDAVDAGGIRGSCRGRNDPDGIQSVVYVTDGGDVTVSFPYEDGYVVGLQSPGFHSDFLAEFDETLDRLKVLGATQVEVSGFLPEDSGKVIPISEFNGSMLNKP